MSSLKYLDKIIQSSLDKIKKENQYDNQKMIRDFRRQESIDTLRKELSVKMLKKNIQWQQTLKGMKEKTEEDLKKKRKQLINTMNRHNQLIEKLKESAIKDKNKTFVEKSLKKSRMLEEIHDKVERAKQIHEDERLNLEVKIKDKIRKLSRRHSEVLLGIRNKFHERSSHSMEVNRQYNEEMERLKEENIKKNDDKGFPIFQKLYYYRLERDQKLKEKRKDRNEKIGKMIENLEKIEKEKKIKYQKTVNNFKKSEQLQMKVKDKNAKRIRDICDKVDERVRNVVGRKEVILFNTEMKNADVLNKEYSRLQNSSIKEYNISLKKSMIAENNLLEKVERDKKISAFLTEVYSLQDRSLMKVTEEKRKQSFFDLRKEEEERKKEELEKLIKNNK